ncbi:MAG: class I SAM-dependent methyltransferase [Opitutales bacterium]
MDGSGYCLLDVADGRKLEQFGPRLLDRPCPQSVGPRRHPERWSAAHARFDLKKGSVDKGVWSFLNPESAEPWKIGIDGLCFHLQCQPTGNVGLFPETRSLWVDLEAWAAARTAPTFLNAFAYTGGATLATARAGAQCCHVDAAKGAVRTARENATASCLAERPIRWIAEDVRTFLAREARRGRTYHGILLDPPSFGRGPDGRVFKIEKDLDALLDQMAALLDPVDATVWLSAHTPGMDGRFLEKALSRALGFGELTSRPMLLVGDGIQVPAGWLARWTRATV